MWHLDDEDAVLREQIADAAHEPVQVVDVVEGVGRRDRRRTAVLLAKPAAHVGAEVLVHDLDARGPDALDEVASRVDADHPQTALDASAKQDALVAADVDEIAGRRDVRVVGESIGQ